jgi:hypothetical protein
MDRSIARAGAWAGVFGSSCMVNNLGGRQRDGGHHRIGASGGAGVAPQLRPTIARTRVLPSVRADGYVRAIARRQRRVLFDRASLLAVQLLELASGHRGAHDARSARTDASYRRSATSISAGRTLARRSDCSSRPPTEPPARSAVGPLRWQVVRNGCARTEPIGPRRLTTR